MPQIAPYPGTGIDRETGKLLAGWPHVMQSLLVIFTTHFGERVLRRWFGSFVPKLLGQNMVPSTVLKFFTAICVAIDLWEPRYKVTSIFPYGSPEQLRTGEIGFSIEGVYRPRALSGDLTPERGVFTIAIGVGADGVRVLRA
jgi:phage baseplate assembly protein W